MSQDERAFRSIAVFGGGMVAWSAALAFARALPRARVSIVETPLDPNALADRLPATLPDIARFHAEIGLDELELVRDGIAVHRLATRYVDWSASGAEWIHAFGDYGLPHANVPFHQLWNRARSERDVRPYHEHSAAAVVAAQDKFTHPSADPRSPLSTYVYGLRVDPDLYLTRLRAAGQVAVSSGEIAGLERREDGAVAAVTLRDGRSIQADLFVDCTGPSASIIGAMESAFENWSELFPFAAIDVDTEPGEPSPLDVMTASADGWRWKLPLARRTMVVRASAGAGARYGWRPDPWVRNVLAFGDSAASIDPVAGTNLHLAQSAILRALELLPGRDCHPVELGEYNRRSRQGVGRVRDFVALHYVRSGRVDGEAWRRAAEAPLPASLARTLEQFEHRGRLPFFEDESFTTDSWAAALLGLGAFPESVDPRAAGVPLEASAAAMERMATQLRATAERVPFYPDYLERMRTAPARSAAR